MRRTTYIKPGILARVMHSTLMRAAITAPAQTTGRGAWHEWELDLTYPGPVSAPLCRTRVIAGEW